MPTFATKEDTFILDRISKLEDSEADIFHLFVNGMGLTDIARELEIPYGTIGTIMISIRAAFNVANSFELLCIVLPAMIRRECDEFNVRGSGK